MSVLALAALLVAPPEGAAAPAQDKIICKSDRNADTGSNIRKRRKICMSAADWKTIETDNEKMRREVFQAPRGEPNPIPGAAGGTGG